MSTSDFDLDQLSPSERTALETYTSVTGQETTEAIPLLRRSQWNVQVGATLFPRTPIQLTYLTATIDCYSQIL